MGHAERRIKEDRFLVRVTVNNETVNQDDRRFRGKQTKNQIGDLQFCFIYIWKDLHCLLDTQEDVLI